MKYYRIKFGYGKDDFISADEDETRKALIAQVTGQVVILKEGSVSGNHIISIVPDYQRELGYNRDYILSGEDYAQVGEKKQREHIQFLTETTERARGVLPEQKRLK